MAGGANSSGGPALAPPHQEQAQSQAMPHHMSQGGPGLNPGPTPIQHGPFGNYQQHPPAGVNGALHSIACRAVCLCQRQVVDTACYIYLYNMLK